MPLAKFIGCVLFALLIQLFLVYPVMLIIFTKANPLRFYRKFMSVMFFAFSTLSSNATIPLTMNKLEDMLNFLIPNYITEGKNQLVISIGCTGGKHRSVTLANELYRKLSGNKEYGLKIEHRDIGKDALRGK